MFVRVPRRAAVPSHRSPVVYSTRAPVATTKASLANEAGGESIAASVSATGRGHAAPPSHSPDPPG